MKKFLSVSLAVATVACTAAFTGCADKLENASWTPDVFEFTYVKSPLSTKPVIYTVGRDKNQNVYLDESDDSYVNDDGETCYGDELIYVCKQKVGVNELQSFDIYQNNYEGKSGYSLVGSDTKHWADIIEDESYFYLYQMMPTATKLADQMKYKEVKTLESFEVLGETYSKVLSDADCIFYSFNDGEEECAVVKSSDGSSQTTVYHAQKYNGVYSISFVCSSIKINHNTNYANWIK